MDTNGNGYMRLDKFLKVSRILKRRSVANEACGAGKAEVNGKSAKPAHPVKPGDTVTLTLGGGKLVFKILTVRENAKKEDAAGMYQVISGE